MQQIKVAILTIALLLAIVVATLLTDNPGSFGRKLEDEDVNMVVSNAKQHMLIPCGTPENGSVEAVGDTYSVIVIASNPHPSNLFRDRERVCAFSEGVVSIQVIEPDPAEPFESTPDSPPFYTGHPPGVTKRVRVYHTGKDGHRPYAASHLKAACEDPAERVVIVLTDEHCAEKPLTVSQPSACWSHMSRHYPINPSRPELEPRHAYIPLGPRDSFPYVHAHERAVPGSSRSYFFNVAVRTHTAPRRRRLVTVSREFREANKDLKIFVNDKLLEADDYRAMVLDSTFTVCPGGHNPETFRMFETLESGSIPIISRRDYLYPSYDAPFPCGEGQASWNTMAASPFAQAVSVASWDELPDLLARLRDSPPEYIDKLQADCVAWYEAFMRRTYNSLLNFGQGYEYWPQDGPIVLDGFPEISEPYGDVPPYDPEEI